ncbi:MAG: flagellar hook-length control protein FliK [bacterium]
MTVQATQFQSPEPHLFQDTTIQNNPDRSFQNYLDEEQKRLVNLFSAFGQFNFADFFSYPDFSSNYEDNSNRVDLLTELENLQPEKNNPNKKSGPEQKIIEQVFFQNAINKNQGVKSIASVFQDLLLQTGWLTPNSQTSPQLYQSQLEGKFLQKLDLQSLVDKILSQIKLVAEKGRAELRFGLKPDNLGEILLTLTSRSGMITIQIETNEETRKILENNLASLALTLKQARVKIEEIKISAIKGEEKNV